MNQFIFSIRKVRSISIHKVSRTSDLIQDFRFHKSDVQWKIKEKTAKDLVRDEPALLRTSLFGEHRFVLKRFSPLKGNNWPLLSIKLTYYIFPYFSESHKPQIGVNWRKIRKNIFKIIERRDFKFNYRECGSKYGLFLEFCSKWIAQIVLRIRKPNQFAHK